MPRQLPDAARGAPRLYTAVRAALWRDDDRASATLVSFVVGSAVFLIGTTYLLHFAIHPPGGGGAALEEAALKSTSDHAMQVLLGTSGYPLAWGGSVDGVTRLGLLQAGSTSRIDALKFDAIAHGSSTSSSSTNGYVDYQEAKTALGLSGHEFHLRSAPIINGALGSDYGVIGMTTYHVAYVGAYSGGAFTSSSVSESATLDKFPIDFTNTVAPGGDVYQDDASFLRTNLVPKLGSTVTQTVISNGNGNPKYDFMVVNGSSYSGLASGSTPSRAVAISDGGLDSATSLGYTKGREARAVIGTANFSGVAAAAVLTWGEYVDTSSDSSDYGFVELSSDGGASWHAVESGTGTLLLNPSRLSTDTAGAWVSRTVTINSANCGSCLLANSVMVGLHWVSDGDATTGHGWVADNFAISGTGFSQTFEKPYYDLLVIGSAVSQNAFTANEIKSAIGDYVNLQGGRLLVLGGEQNTQWLQPLMHVGISGSTSAVAHPDVTHPLLSVPNQLDWASYTTNNKVWDFSGGVDSSLFTGVVETTAGQDILAVSNTGAFGAYGANGSVILTTYLPYTMTSDQEARFFANALTYGRYRPLYFDLGPEVPLGIPVAVSTRSATIDMSNAASGVYTEIGLTMYLWDGTTTGSGTSSSTSALPSPPRALNATPWNGAVKLNWTWPTSNGTAPIVRYDLYRSTSVGNESFYQTFTNTTFTYNDTSVTNGVTYYYNLTANSTVGTSASSIELSATPSTIPSAPVSLASVGGAGFTTLSWSSPVSNGGSSLSQYKVYRAATSGGALTLLATVSSSTTTYQDTTVQMGATYYYNVSATNPNGEGPLSAQTSGYGLSTPGAVVAAAVANSLNHTITITWNATPVTAVVPAPSAYNIYAANTSGAEVFIAAVGGSTLTYFDGGVNNGTTRYYRVTANNSAGEGAASAETSATPTGIPVQVAGLTVITTPASAGSLTLAWTAPSSWGVGATAGGFVIYRGTTSGVLTQLTTVSSASVSYIDASVGSANALRYYTVVAYTTTGVFGANSTEASARTYDVPAAPTLVSVVAGLNHQLTITWTAPSSAMTIANYTVYRTAQSGASGTEVPLATSSFTVPTCATTGGPCIDSSTTGTGKTYLYEITAWSAAGQSAFSNEVAGITT